MTKLDTLKKYKNNAQSLHLFGIIFMILGFGLFAYFMLAQISSSYYTYVINYKVILMAFTPVVIGFILLLLYARQYKKYRFAYKESVVDYALGKVFDDYEYEPHSGFSLSYVKKMGLIGLGDDFKSTDFIHAEYKDVDIVQSNIHITRQETYTNSKGETQTRTVTIYLGKWSIYTFNKNFNEDVICVGCNFSDSRVGGLFTSLNKVKLESDSFNSVFKTYTTDNGHTAFYLLTPQVINELLIIAKAYHYKIMYAFIDNKLHVLVNNGHAYFEPGSIYSKISIEDEVNKIIKETKNNKVLIDRLKLDNQLFKGGY